MKFSMTIFMDSRDIIIHYHFHAAIHDDFHAHIYAHIHDYFHDHFHAHFHGTISAILIRDSLPSKYSSKQKERHGTARSGTAEHKI